MLLRISTVRTALADFMENETARRKPLKSGQRERAHREGHEDSAGPVKTFQAPAILKTMSLGCERKAI